MADISITTPFRLTTMLPLDARLKPVTYRSELNNIQRDQRYEGMTVYVASEDVEYWLYNGVDNDNWVKKNTFINCGEF